MFDWLWVTICPICEKKVWKWQRREERQHKIVGEPNPPVPIKGSGSITGTITARITGGSSICHKHCEGEIERSAALEIVLPPSGRVPMPWEG